MNKRKSFRHFLQEDRIKMEVLLEQGFSLAQVARKIGFNKSSVSREFKKGVKTVRVKNGNFKKYEPEFFEKQVYSSRNVQKRTVACYKIDKFNGLAERITELICKCRYSPSVVSEEIGGLVCHKTIYNYISKGIIKAKNIDLWLKLRRKTCKPKPKVHKRIFGQSIDVRPPGILSRKEFGHIEGDLVLGKKSGSVLLTLVERKTRHGFVLKLPNRKADTIYTALQEFLKNHRWVKSITFDNGSEFALAYKLPIPVYFAHPYSAWERGTNEHFNGMLRRFIRKGRPISKFEHAVNWVNNLPRKILDFKSAAQLFLSELTA